MKDFSFILIFGLFSCIFSNKENSNKKNEIMQENNNPILGNNEKNEVEYAYILVGYRDGYPILYSKGANACYFDNDKFKPYNLSVTSGTLLFINDTYGSSQHRFLLDTWKQIANLFEDKGPIWMGSECLASNYKPLVESKGAYIHHMLNAILPQEHYMKALGRICEAFTGKQITTSAFKAKLENYIITKVSRKTIWFGQP